MREIGPRFELKRVYRHDNEHWSLFISDDRETFVELLDSKNTLYLSTDIQLPQHLRVDKNELQQDAEKIHLLNQFYMTLMGFNSLWEKTGGFSFGLINNMKIELSLPIIAFELSLQEFGNKIIAFDKQAKHWITLCNDFGLNNSKVRSELSLDTLINHNYLLKV